jgi:hypothetical protein
LGNCNVSEGHTWASRRELANSHWGSAAGKRTRPVGAKVRIMRCMLSHVLALMRPSVRNRSNWANQSFC